MNSHSLKIRRPSSAVTQAFCRLEPVEDASTTIPSRWKQESKAYVHLKSCDREASRNRKWNNDSSNQASV